MNSRWLVLPYLTCALTLAQAAGAQTAAETTPPEDTTAPEAPPPPPPPPEPEPAPVAPPPAPVPAPAPAPAPVEEKPGLGAGTLELRIQTLTHVASPYGSTAPGFWYDLDNETWSLNLTGGVGYFLTPALAIGGDVGFVGNDELSIITLAPFLKFVTGLEERAIGFVGELSPGFVTVDTGDSNGLSLTLFAGVHVPVGSSVALQGGAQLTRLEDFDDFGDGVTVIGLRYGLSVYL